MNDQYWFYNRFARRCEFTEKDCWDIENRKPNVKTVMDGVAFSFFLHNFFIRDCTEVFYMLRFARRCEFTERDCWDIEPFFQLIIGFGCSILRVYRYPILNTEWSILFLQKIRTAVRIYWKRLLGYWEPFLQLIIGFGCSILKIHWEGYWMVFNKNNRKDAKSQRKILTTLRSAKTTNNNLAPPRLSDAINITNTNIVAPPLMHNGELSTHRFSSRYLNGVNI